jgi:hypothetical protein
MSLLDLVRHMAEVERRRFAGLEISALYKRVMVMTQPGLSLCSRWTR